MKINDLCPIYILVDFFVIFVIFHSYSQDVPNTFQGWYGSTNDMDKGSKKMRWEISIFMDSTWLFGSKVKKNVEHNSTMFFKLSSAA